jgi:hypothetical protein
MVPGTETEGRNEDRFTISVGNEAIEDLSAFPLQVCQRGPVDHHAWLAPWRAGERLLYSDETNELWFPAAFCSRRKKRRGMAVRHEIIIEHAEKYLELTPDLWAQLLPNTPKMLR